MLLLLKKFILPVAIILVLSSSDMFAQALSNPLFPVTEGTPQDIGLFVAVGQNYQNGTMDVDCDSCFFKDGTKFGWTIGALYDVELVRGIRLGLMASFDDYSIKSQFLEYEFPPFTNKLGVSERFPISFHHVADANFKFFSLTPFIKFSPVKFFYFRLGGSMAFNISNSIKHDKELLTKTVTASDGTVFNVQYEMNLKTVQTVQDGDFQGMNKLQFFLVPMLGFDIKASERLYLSPFFMMDVPVTHFSSQGDAFSIGTWRVAFEMRYALLKPRSWEK